MVIGDVLNRLDNVLETSAGQWEASCPCHDDQRASLSVAVDGGNGKVLLYCHAGCSFHDIARAVALPRRVEAGGGAGRRERRPSKIYSASYYAVIGLPWTLVSGWDYRYADGSEAFSVYRLERADGRKEIRPVKPTRGGYCFGLPPAPRPLYRLPELLRHDGAVVVVEGEKAASAIIAAGWHATTSCGGASGAKRTDWEPLALRRVWVWPDNDEAGLQYAEAVAGILAELGSAVTVLPGVGEPGDDAADCGDINGHLLAAMT